MRTDKETTAVKRGINARMKRAKDMATHEPKESAKRQMEHKAYQVGKLIRAQGTQMEEEK